MLDGDATTILSPADDAAATASGAFAAAATQWRRAGGHALLRVDAPIAAAACEAFSLVQAAASLDRAADCARVRLRELNADGVSAAPAKRVRSNGDGARAAAADDDVSDGSALQGGLVERNVREGKRREVLSWRDAEAARAPDGSLRLLAGNVLTPDECALLVGGGLVAMAGAFSRCGQTTLGLSPALAARLAVAPDEHPSGMALPDALPLLYRAVERVRRRVATAFDAPAHTLRLSDATLTRLQPLPSNDTRLQPLPSNDTRLQPLPSNDTRLQPLPSNDTRLQPLFSNDEAAGGSRNEVAAGGLAMGAGGERASEGVPPPAAVSSGALDVAPMEGTSGWGPMEGPSGWGPMEGPSGWGPMPPPAAVSSGALDVGLLRGDQFCYWRPHIDQVRATLVSSHLISHLISHRISSATGGRTSTR
jgi:hypothetical protein